MNWKKLPFVQQVHARPRLGFAFVLGVGLFLAIPSLGSVGDTTRFLLSWNAAVGLYLVLAGFMMAQSSQEKIRLRALHHQSEPLPALPGPVVGLRAGLRVSATAGLVRPLT